MIARGGDMMVRCAIMSLIRRRYCTFRWLTILHKDIQLYGRTTKSNLLCLGIWRTNCYPLGTLGHITKKLEDVIIRHLRMWEVMALVLVDPTSNIDVAV